MPVVAWILGVIFMIFSFRSRRHSSVGIITTKDGSVYGFNRGNYLRSPTSVFHGIEVLLPYRFVDFYLDSHKDSHLRGPGALYDSSQIIELEGDFHKNFRLFAPEGTSTDVLSVITPDVMQVLIESSRNYDVELQGNYLRIIAPKPVRGLGDQIALQNAAQAIIEELSHRARTWQQAPRHSRKLKYKPGSTYKVHSHTYIRRSAVFKLTITLLISVVLTGIGLAYYFTTQDSSFSDPYSKGVIAGTVIYASLAILLIVFHLILYLPIYWFLISYRGRG